MIAQVEMLRMTNHPFVMKLVKTFDCKDWSASSSEMGRHTPLQKKEGIFLAYGLSGAKTLRFIKR